jgi:succinate dehydrogenase/fumarate reductase flavoprotein subunit/uncharacterized protein with FMN-binding domain
MALLLVAALAFTGCPSPTDSGDSGRTPVKDGIYFTKGLGKSTSSPMSVTSTFANNVLVDISIGTHGETGPILDSVKTLMIPRMIEAQSIGVDIIAGATYSSAGLRQAVAAAITEGGGKPEEWENPPPKSSRKVTLTGYDVIVVGLGGAGLSAYLKASEPVSIGGQQKLPSVYGIEAAGKIGGNSATAGGPLATNSQYIKTFYGIGDYADEDALLRQWYADMGAKMDADAASQAEASRLATTDNITYTPVFGPGPVTLPVPPITSANYVAEYAGGPKWRIIKKLVEESGETVDWLGQDYGFHFNRPSGLSFPQYQIVINYGGERWENGAYNYDGFGNEYKTTMFTRAMDTAKARNSKNAYKLELRATDILKDTSEKIIGVKATYRDGTIYEVYGKTVILATGGFIGDPSMKNQYYGSNIKSEAVDTERGDGIKMGLAAGAAPYNVDMPAVTHIAHVKNIVRDELFSDPVKDARYKSTITALLLRGDGLVVGLKKGPPWSHGEFDYTGKRFSNEAPALFALDGLDFQNWMVGGSFAAIISNDDIQRIKTNGIVDPRDTIFWMTQNQVPGPGQAIGDIDDIIAKGKKKGNVVQAATLDDLAAALGVNAQTLKDSVNRYNGFVDAGLDGDYGKQAPYLVTKVTADATVAGGYTAILGEGYYYCTTGGLDVDEYARALNGNKQVIPGLYVTGNDSGGVLYNRKKAYVGYGAAAQGWAVTSGRFAGEHAAQYALSN